MNATFSRHRSDPILNEHDDDETDLPRTNDKFAQRRCGACRSFPRGFPTHLFPTLGKSRFSLDQPTTPKKEKANNQPFCCSGLTTQSMLDKNINSPTREGTVSSIQSSESADNNTGKPSRKRKRKGLGNWTRTTLACVRCRKMKIRVSYFNLWTDPSATMLDLVVTVSGGHMSVSRLRRMLLKPRSSTFSPAALGLNPLTPT